MKQRSIIDKVQGFRTTDGAGVSLVRVLGHETTEDFDPILMLDSFDSENPEDYIKGFPVHPHRGIETITFLERGAMAHRDSLGNSGVIESGDVQWMTAGSGIMHEEMPEPVPRILGVQVWLNLPAKQKMTPPSYHSLTKDGMPVVPVEGGQVTIVSGAFRGTQGFSAPYHPLRFLSIKLEAGQSLELETDPEAAVMLFTLEHDAEIAGQPVAAKTAVRLDSGDLVTVRALDQAAQILYFESPRLEEPIAWAGPIVMNSREELHQAWLDLRNDEFIKDQASGI